MNRDKLQCIREISLQRRRGTCPQGPPTASVTRTAGLAYKISPMHRESLYRLQAPTAEEATSVNRIKKAPQPSTIFIASAVSFKPILCAAPHMSPNHNTGVSPWGAAHRILMSHAQHDMRGVVQNPQHEIGPSEGGVARGVERWRHFTHIPPRLILDCRVVIGQF